MLTTGVKGIKEITVENCMTAKAVGSGELDVFSTPSMAALIEETAWKSVSDELKKGETTVGTKLEITHVSATPAGAKVRCETELINVDRRRLIFLASVFDENGKIGDGTHERFIVNKEKFMNKAAHKFD